MWDIAWHPATSTDNEEAVLLASCGHDGRVAIWQRENDHLRVVFSHSLSVESGAKHSSINSVAWSDRAASNGASPPVSFCTLAAGSSNGCVYLFRWIQEFTGKKCCPCCEAH